MKSTVRISLLLVALNLACRSGGLAPASGANTPRGAQIGKPGTVYLSDLDWVSATQMRRDVPPLKDKTLKSLPEGAPPEHVPIAIGGRTFPKGLMVNPRHYAPGGAKITYRLDRAYSKLVMWVGISDEIGKKNPFEWGRIDADGRFVELERPGGKWNAPEGNNLLRISAGATVAVIGDGKVLAKTQEFYFDSDPIKVEADLSGTTEMTIVISNDHHERCEAPYRRGLDPCPVLVKGCAWFNHVCMGDPILHRRS